MERLSLPMGYLQKKIIKGKENRLSVGNEVAGFRDVAAHSYDTINMDDLYITIKEDFPELKEKMGKLRYGLD